jgi:predicted DNA-binding protein with PD1-like motif
MRTLALLLSAFVSACAAKYTLPPPFEPGKAPGMRVQRLSDEGRERRWAIVFRPGDEILSGLTEFARQEKLGASQFTAIGAIQDGVLGWFDKDRRMYMEIPIDAQAEVLSLIGDVALVDDTPVVHAHMTVGLADGSAKGGHLLRAHVWPTLEVILVESPNALHKEKDPETGLPLIAPNGQR